MTINTVQTVSTLESSTGIMWTIYMMDICTTFAQMVKSKNMSWKSLTTILMRALRIIAAPGTTLATFMALAAATNQSLTAIMLTTLLTATCITRMVTTVTITVPWL